MPCGNGVAAVALPDAQAVSQLLRRQAGAVFVQHDASHAFGQGGFEALRFGRHALRGGSAGAAGFGLQRLQFQPHLCGEALGKFSPGGVGPGRLALAHGHHPQFHRPRDGAFLAGARRGGVFLATVFWAMAFLAGGRVVFTTIVFTGEEGLVFFAGAFDATRL